MDGNGVAKGYVPNYWQSVKPPVDGKWHVYPWDIFECEYFHLEEGIHESQATAEGAAKKYLSLTDPAPVLIFRPDGSSYLYQDGPSPCDA